MTLVRDIWEGRVGIFFRWRRHDWLLQTINRRLPGDDQPDTNSKRSGCAGLDSVTSAGEPPRSARRAMHGDVEQTQSAHGQSQHKAEKKRSEEHTSELQS